jgi:formamidopyrimidine-DNA glycosylase
MPELPEVEGYRRYFAEHATGRTIRSVVADPTILRNITLRSLRAALAGHRFDAPERHGKWLVAWTDGPALLLHFGMTGDLLWAQDALGRHRWDRLILVFDGGELRYRNMRKLGGVWLAHGADGVAALLGGLGPDALSLTLRGFDRVLARRRGGVKAALMDQAILAGVGNLLADEILWRARIHPRRRIDSLSPEERRRLASAMVFVVRRTAEDGDDARTKGRWLMPVRGRPGATCPRCRTTLARTVAAGRTTYFCPTCQPESP